MGKHVRSDIPYKARMIMNKYNKCRRRNNEWGYRKLCFRLKQKCGKRHNGYLMN